MSQEETKENWEKAYEKILSETREILGEIKEKDEDRRETPRFKLNSGQVWIKVETPFEIIDLSKNGASFFSHLPFPPGNILFLALDKAFQIEAEIISCDLEEMDDLLMELRYRVSCRFTNKEHGMQLVVMFKEMDKLELIPS